MTTAFPVAPSAMLPTLDLSKFHAGPGERLAYSQISATFCMPMASSTSKGMALIQSLLGTC